MGKKELALLSEIESLERLLYRLPDNHSSREFIQVEIFKAVAGKRGEERLFRKMIEFEIEEQYRFLKNICLSRGQWKVQMDGLLLTERGAIVIESKNISGQLYFDDDTGEFSRTNTECVKTIMEDPTIQLNKHIRFLTLFFKQQNIDLPISGIVVFTSKQCEFLAKPKKHHICKTYQLVDYLFDILQEFPLKSKPQDLSEIQKLLEQSRTPYKRKPLCQLYSIEETELFTGILCTSCKSLNMMRKHKKGWLCADCQAVDLLAFQHTVQEYFSLINTQLSNRQLRKFCKLESPYVTSRLLKAYDLETAGALHNRTYFLKKND
ncbi:nuclease-related domain-containing protein [Planococcus maritimus]|uniref:nuclease-related domain-containing protein n=1 Tax=Planococcus maritimus TaxID=192421 RepID=UPI00232E8B50|nr:nuclease-related domain-containing protein [Planococcus maritimus]